MSQTEVQLIKADAVQTGDIANSAVTDAKIAGLTSSKLTGALPAISGAALTNLPASGISQSSTWRLISNTTIDSSQVILTSNLEECDNSSYTRIGSAFTESSGVFTFPATGIYLIEATGMFYVGSGSSPYPGMGIQITTDNGSNYDRIAISYSNIYTSQSYGSSYCAYQFDVTNTSTHKVRFITDSANSSAIISGTTNDNHTFFQFTRLGDT